MKTAVTQTSIEAYHTLDLNPQHRAIMDALQALDASCIADLADYLGWQKSTVAARLNELKHDERIMLVEKRKSETTKVVAEFWRVRSLGMLF